MPNGKRCVKVSFYLPRCLHRVALALCREQHMRNIGRFFIALLIDAMMHRARWELYRAIANADSEEQDLLVQVLQQYPIVRDESFHHFLERAKRLNELGTALTNGNSDKTDP